VAEYPDDPAEIGLLEGRCPNGCNSGMHNMVTLSKKAINRHTRTFRVEMICLVCQDTWKAIVQFDERRISPSAGSSGS
jgi:hypothetical protein